MRRANYLDAVPRPLLAEATRGVRAENSDGQINQTANDRDLDRKTKEPEKQGEDARQNQGQGYDQEHERR